MSVLLKWELDALGAASKYYRFRENQLQRHARQSNLPNVERAREQMHAWRTVTNRREARAATLAYGFCRGRNYWEMEERCHTAPDFERMQDFVIELGLDQSVNALRKWTEEARAYLEAYPPTTHNRAGFSPPSLPNVLGFPMDLGIPTYAVTFKFTGYQPA